MSRVLEVLQRLPPHLNSHKRYLRHLRSEFIPVCKLSQGHRFITSHDVSSILLDPEHLVIALFLREESPANYEHFIRAHLVCPAPQNSEISLRFASHNAYTESVAASKWDLRLPGPVANAQHLHVASSRPISVQFQAHVVFQGRPGL